MTSHPTSRRRRTATSPPTTTSTSSASTRATRRRTRGSLRTAAVDGRGRGRGRASRRSIDIDDAARLVPARGARLPHALRRGVVDGDPVGRLPARRPRSSASSRRRARSTSRSRRCSTREQMPGQQREPCSTGRTSRGCASTRRCTRSRSSPSGLYGKALPNQNGAPLRLVVPWKYGFKGIKSIVKIRFTETQPPTTWNRAAPDEYGFYANVNPAVDHPRWSQATRAPHRRVPAAPDAAVQRLRASRWPRLYAGMDLRAELLSRCRRAAGRCPGSSRASSSARSSRSRPSRGAAARGELGANPIAAGAQPARPARADLPRRRRSRARRSRRSSAGPGRSGSAGCSASSPSSTPLLHVATYAGLDQLLDWRAIWEDVTKRKFIFVGFAAFVLLVPLAVTSTQRRAQAAGLRALEAPPPARVRRADARR